MPLPRCPWNREGPKGGRARKEEGPKRRTGAYKKEGFEIQKMFCRFLSQMHGKIRRSRSNRQYSVCFLFIQAFSILTSTHVSPFILQPATGPILPIIGLAVLRGLVVVFYLFLEDVHSLLSNNSSHIRYTAFLEELSNVGVVTVVPLRRDVLLLKYM